MAVTWPSARISGSLSTTLSLNYRINAGTLVQPRAAKANRVAADAEITGAAETLRSVVTQQYIAVLRADANAALQDTLVAVQRANLELAKARVAVGADNILAVRRAEVTLGQAEVAALTAHNTAEVEKVRSSSRSAFSRRASVQLTTTFAVAKPTFTFDSVLDLARRVKSQRFARFASARARRAGTCASPSRTTRRRCSLSTGWSGNVVPVHELRFSRPAGDLEQSARTSQSCLSQDSVRTA